MPSKTLPLTLDASALASDPAWLEMSLEHRGVLFSLLLAHQLHGRIPFTAMAAARLAGVDPSQMQEAWKVVSPWFTRDGGCPLLAPGVQAALRRREKASKAARARFGTAVSPDAQAMLKQCSSNARAMLGHVSSDISDPDIEVPPSPGALGPSVDPPPPLPPTPPIPTPSSGDSLNLFSFKDSRDTNSAHAHEAGPVPTESPISGWRDWFRDLPPAALASFELACSRRQDHVERMSASLRALRGVAAHRPKPAAEAFAARVRSGFEPRLLGAAFWLYLQGDENVARGYVQGLDVFFGNPRGKRTKATFEGFLDAARAFLARQDARGAGAPPSPSPEPPAGLPGLDEALRSAGLPLPATSVLQSAGERSKL